MKILIIIVVVFISCKNQTDRPVLEPIYPKRNITGTLINSDIKKYQMMVLDSGDVYFEGKQVFREEGKYKQVIYEKYGKNILVITPIDDKMKYNSAIYIYPKKEIVVIDIVNNKKYWAKVDEKKIASIDVKNKYVEVLDTKSMKNRIKLIKYSN